MGFTLGEILGQRSRPPEAKVSTDAVGLCSCGKQMYGDRKAAGVIAREMNGRNTGQRMTPYRCPLCMHFHVGHARGRD